MFCNHMVTIQDYRHTDAWEGLVPKTTGYRQWNCQVIRPANYCHLIPSNWFLDGFPDPSQFSAAKLTHYSAMQTNNRHRRSKKTQPARGWTVADISTNRVYTIPAPRDGGPIPFFGKPGVAPCRLDDSAPHKIGGRRVKSWPDDTHKQTHSSHLDL